MEALLRLPVVVTEIAKEPAYSIYMLEDIKTNVNWLASTHQAQPSPHPSMYVGFVPWDSSNVGSVLKIYYNKELYLNLNDPCMPRLLVQSFFSSPM